MSIPGRQRRNGSVNSVPVIIEFVKPVEVAGDVLIMLSGRLPAPGFPEDAGIAALPGVAIRRVGLHGQGDNGRDLGVRAARVRPEAESGRR
jgi:hypothetical protein